MNRSVYALYLKSAGWKARKVSYYARHERRCFVCGYPRVDLHHSNYARLGREMDSDLVPLCQKHHRLVHALVRGRRAPLATAHFEALRIYRGDSVFVPGPSAPERRKSPQSNRSPPVATAPKRARGQRKRETEVALKNHREQRARSILVARLGGIDLLVYEALPPHGQPKVSVSDLATRTGIRGTTVTEKVKAFQKLDLISSSRHRKPLLK